LKVPLSLKIGYIGYSGGNCLQAPLCPFSSDTYGVRVSFFHPCEHPFSSLSAFAHLCHTFILSSLLLVPGHCGLKGMFIVSLSDRLYWSPR
jgi:hypothetical protein